MPIKGMPPINQQSKNSKDGKRGKVTKIDNIQQGDPLIASAIGEFGDYIDTNRSSQRWAWAVQWVENILFGAGRHYTDDVLINRLTADSAGENLSVVRAAIDNIPKPVNDLVGRYVDTNIALLTENKPMPRVTAKSDDIRDIKASELSELTLEYLWEALNLPEKHRDIARLILYCGVAWLEVCYDPLVPRHIKVPQTEEADFSVIQGPNGQPIKVPVRRPVTKRNPKTGEPIYDDSVTFGDVAAKVVSPFEMHLPSVHNWNGEDMGWIMREEYVSIDDISARIKMARKATKDKFTKKMGWQLQNLDGVQSENITKLPLWWWERLSSLVEGPQPALYIGTPEQWDGYAVMRVFDRKPNEQWPKGRTVITIGDKLIYDSPKDIGARAYSSRWPNRWHPYVRFRYEPLPGSLYGRALVSKLLPYLKRVNAIDTTLIMWRRTIPFSAWVAPKGTHPQKDLWSGRPGLIWEFDPKQTAGMAPEPVQPPSYPEAAMREREMMIQHMEFVAGTEEILRGQRPGGVTSAAAIDLMRKQALSSKSSLLQGWDESLQVEGSILLQETIKNVNKDDRYLERIKILAREKASRLTIKTFSGEDISDNVAVNIDTASQALLSKEAKEAKTLEFLQAAGNLMSLPLGVQQAVLNQLGFNEALNPAGEDVERVKRMIGWIKNGQFERVIPMPEDDPYIMYEFLKKELKSDNFWDMDPTQQQVLVGAMDKYKEMIQAQIMAQQLQQQAALEAEAAAQEAPRSAAQQNLQDRQQANQSKLQEEQFQQQRQLQREAPKPAAGGKKK